jgi:hypothetical protein
MTVACQGGRWELHHSRLFSVFIIRPADDGQPSLIFLFYRVSTLEKLEKLQKPCFTKLLEFYVVFV